jgi:hypothetical protein
MASVGRKFLCVSIFSFWKQFNKNRNPKFIKRVKGDKRNENFGLLQWQV